MSTINYGCIVNQGLRHWRKNDCFKNIFVNRDFIDWNICDCGKYQNSKKLKRGLRNE